MLTINFPGHPIARAIIVDESVNGVSGFLECGVCDKHLVLMALGTDRISTEIEQFIKAHHCRPFARRSGVIALAEKLKGSLPDCEVRIMRRPRYRGG